MGSGAGMAEVVRVGGRVGGAVVGCGALNVVDGGATTVASFDELLTITNASTRPTTSRTAATAPAHNHRDGFFGGSGGGGGPAG
jgi:hypothetical protein